MSPPATPPSRIRKTAPASDPIPPPMKYAFMRVLLCRVDAKLEMARRKGVRRPQSFWLCRGSCRRLLQALGGDRDQGHEQHRQDAVQRMMNHSANLRLQGARLNLQRVDR